MTDENRITRKTLISLGFVVPLVVSLVMGGMGYAVMSFRVSANEEEIQEIKKEVSMTYVRKDVLNERLENIEKSLEEIKQTLKNNSL